jgi:hypothetical protein
VFLVDDEFKFGYSIMFFEELIVQFLHLELIDAQYLFLLALADL